MCLPATISGACELRPCFPCVGVMADGSLPSGGTHAHRRAAFRQPPRAGGEARCQGGALRLCHPGPRGPFMPFLASRNTLRQFAERSREAGCFSFLEPASARTSAQIVEWMSLPSGPPVKRPPGPDLEMGFSKTGPAPGIANVQGRQVLALGKAFAGLSLLKVLGISFLRFAVKGNNKLGGWK